MQEILNYVAQKSMKDEVPDGRVGDTVRVMVRVAEGTGKDARFRLQAYEGVIISRTGGGINETIKVRRVTHGVGIERTFPLHSPVVADVQIVRHGKVRRSKLYYLRDRVGKNARVREQSRDTVIVREKKATERADARAAAETAAAAAAETAAAAAAEDAAAAEQSETETENQE